ncbi:site-specific integrase [Virgisporangium aurantiacum]|uniref:Phage integrase n=1 Tax=Virgisporangium aurantiacum TaxID=175570 RepID=A0A8J4E5Z1_9ACTN|nr:site-specific integrase [Virgisporangium aurantiacum]GIJ62664.1 phage integrase [Virgisporangium aurantiacum]
MARPSLPLGTHGEIRYYGSGKRCIARTLYRDYDGVTRQIERWATSKAAAGRALKEALRDRLWVDTAAEISPDTKLQVVAEAWWLEFDESDASPGTKRVYRERLDQQIIPSLGGLRCREVTIGVVQRCLTAVKHNHGPSLTKTVRTVLSNVCKFAARHDAMKLNPVRETATISVKPKKGVAKALAVEEIKQLRALLTYDDRAISRDLLDLVDVMAATGLRIGEALALVWDAIDLEAGTVEVRSTVIRIKGQGLVIKPEPKTDAGYRTLVLPSWCKQLLKARWARSDLSWGELRLVFPSAVATLRDPSNVDHHLKDAFVWAGLPDITSHIFRKTVATLMDKAGLSARAGADQLGHAQVSMTQNTYFGRKVSDTGAADVLEVLNIA